MSASGAFPTNPYVGLRPFFQEDSMFFFGRDAQTAELLDTLHRERFLSVVGSSGCGKSSLVRAGMVPLLLAGFLVQDRDRWSIARMKPGDAPLANLAEALADLDSGPEATSAEELESAIREGHTQGVLDFLRRVLGERANFLLVVDQFEEIFAFRRDGTGRRGAEAADFVDLLLKLSEDRSLPIYVTLTMRTDFLGDCDLFYGLPEAMNRGRYLVPRLTRQQLRDAIQGPVLLMRAQMAPRLVDRLLNQLGDRSDRLPVLQHALLRTWDAWADAGKVGPIDLHHYQESGGLDGALAKDAEKALAGTDEVVTARIFQRLTDTDNNRRRVRSPARMSELVAASGASREEVEAVIERFREDDRNFLYAASDGRPEDPRIDLAHESLIRQWATLRSWVDQERVSRDRFLEYLERARGGLATLKEPDLSIARGWRARLDPSTGWAGRYSDREDDLKAVLDYLDRSVEEAEADARRERELREREKELAAEERRQLEREARRREREARIGMGAAVLGLIATVGVAFLWQRAVAAEARALEAAGLVESGVQVIQNSAEMNELWWNTDEPNEAVLAAYERLLPDSLNPPAALVAVWEPILDSLRTWEDAFQAAQAADDADTLGINQKMQAWRDVAARARREGPNVRTINSRIGALQADLETRFTVARGYPLFCVRPPSDTCVELVPRGSPTRCPGSPAAGEDICVIMAIDTFDPSGRERVVAGRYAWLSSSGEVLDEGAFDNARGPAFRYAYPAGEFPEGPSTIRLVDEEGVIVFQEVVDLSVQPGRLEAIADM